MSCLRMILFAFQLLQTLQTHRCCQPPSAPSHLHHNKHTCVHCITALHAERTTTPCCLHHVLFPLSSLLESLSFGTCRIHSQKAPQPLSQQVSLKLAVAGGGGTAVACMLWWTGTPTSWGPLGASSGASCCWQCGWSLAPSWATAMRTGGLSSEPILGW